MYSRSYNSNIFTDINFLSCYVTDRPYPSLLEADALQTTMQLSTLENIANVYTTVVGNDSHSSTGDISPKDIYPSPKAGPRKGIRKIRTRIFIVLNHISFFSDRKHGIQ